MMFGPNTNLGHNSIIVMSEAQANYIGQCIKEIKNQSWKSMEVKPAILQDYHKKTQERLKKMIWNVVDKSWYKSANGNIPNNYPGRTTEYKKVTKKVNFSDFNIG